MDPDFQNAFDNPEVLKSLVLQVPKVFDPSKSPTLTHCGDFRELRRSGYHLWDLVGQDSKNS